MGFEVRGFWCGVFEVRSFGIFKVLGFGFWLRGFGFEVFGVSRFGVEGYGCEVLGFDIRGLELGRLGF